MNLEKLYSLQVELDEYILDKHGLEMTSEELFDNTILALSVEIAELANTTRCFKHWSTKGMMYKEIILDELADVWHFYLSIGNQIDYRLEGELAQEHSHNIVKTFNTIYYWVSEVELGEDSIMNSLYNYLELGNWISILWSKLGFTNEEVEQAYLKKHEENYKRQREGY